MMFDKLNIYTQCANGLASKLLFWRESLSQKQEVNKNSRQLLWKQQPQHSCSNVLQLLYYVILHVPQQQMVSDHVQMYRNYRTAAAHV